MKKVQIDMNSTLNLHSQLANQGLVVDFNSMASFDHSLTEINNLYSMQYITKKVRDAAYRKIFRKILTLINEGDNGEREVVQRLQNAQSMQTEG